MPSFEVTGSVDPLLKVHLNAGETIFCESGAMVAMDERLSLTGKSRGGIASALGRKLLNEESFFQQKIAADLGAGDVLLSPTLAGDVWILDVGSERYTIAAGCYLANTEGVKLGTKTQGLGKALFASTGSGLKGFFVQEASGTGQLVVSGFGSMREVIVTPENPQIIDNGHLVAWDSSLHYELALNTGHKGFFGKMVESVVSGEGVVLKFSGKGRVIVCSRNREAFLNWIESRMPQPTAK